MLRFAFLVSFFLPAMLHAQADIQSAKNVVQIRCSTSMGDKKATGFVWPEPGFVVTALHVVGGCRELIVYSEDKGDQTIASIERVHLESDLALLKLQDGMGLKSIPMTKNQPNTREKHFIWGYPQRAEEMLDIPLDFAGGLKRGVTTLAQAFGGSEIRELFREKSSPTPNTQILRVSSTIRPGHSGAPILNAKGQVVAIADGGLLGGWKGVNWSIPAHIYLPQLQESRDNVPRDSGQVAGLFSSVTATEDKITAVVSAAPKSNAKYKSEFRLVRRVPLWVVGDEIDADGSDLVEQLDIIEDAMGEKAYLNYTFDIYEDPTTGATLGLPSGIPLRFDRELGALVAEDDRGDVILRMTIGAYKGKNYDDALDFGVYRFADAVASVADLDDPIQTIEYDEWTEGPNTKLASFWGETEGTDRKSGLFSDVSLDLMVRENVFLGAALYIIGEDQDYDDQDDAMAALFEIGAYHLTDFAYK